MSNSESVRAAEAEILAAFQRFDVNRDGRISEAEFVAILTRETSQRTSLAPDQAKQLFAKADLDRAGHVVLLLGGQWSGRTWADEEVAQLQLDFTVHHLQTRTDARCL